MEETETKTGRNLGRDLQTMEAEVNFKVTWDAIFFYGSCPATQITEVLGLLADMIIRPQLREQTFDRLRNQLLHEIENKKQSVPVFTQERFLSEIFQENPYRHSIQGNLETLKNLNITDIKIQYRKLFIPNQAQLALYHSDKEKGDSIFNILSRRWGSWIKDNPMPFTFRPAQQPKEPRIMLFDLHSEETIFRWGKLSVKRGASNYYTLKVLEQYITLSLPGWTRGITTSNQIRASSTLETGRMPGYIQLNIQAPSDQILAYFKKFRTFVNEIQKGKVDMAKFEEAKRLSYLELITSLEKPLPRLFQLLETTLYGLGVNFITNYGLRLNKVTPEDFPKILPDHLSLDNFVMIVAGPADKLKDELDSIGQTTVLP